MTAAEQMFHNTGLKAPASATSNIDTTSASRLNVADVSSQFNLEYYVTMSRQPEHLHGFYGKQSQMVHSVEGDLEAPICTTLETIHARIMAMGYQGARVIVESIDAQASLNGGIFILTTGNMKLKSGVMKKFVQSFFLAEQPNGYYVLNDCFRFVEAAPAVSPAQPDKEAALAPAPVAKPVVVEAAKAVEKAEPKPAPSPVKEKPVEATPVAPPKDKKPMAAEKPLEKAPSPKIVITTKKAAEEPKKAAVPNSWASLAAGGTGMWQNGVVVPTKTPAVTVAAAEPAKRDQSGRSAAPKTGERDKRQDRPARDREVRSPRSETKPGQDFARSIFVRNIGINPESAALCKTLETFGVITSFDLHAAKGQAFVEFQTVQMAQKAVSSGVQFNGATLNIELRRPAGSRGPSGGAPRGGRPFEQ